MGRIAIVESFVRIIKNGIKFSESKVNPSSGNNITGEHFSDAGDDSVPLPEDYAITESIPSSGRSVIVGYIDPKNSQKSQAGEKRIYARDSDGEEVSQIWLKNDGSITINSILDININGARITPSGDFVTASGVSLDNHPHNQANDSGGNTEEPTNAPTPTEV